MEATTAIKPKTMAELLPGLSGILSRDAMQTLTAKKQPRQTIAQTRTAEKVIKPLTIAEMRADILALKIQSPRRFAHATTSNKKKIWNSSCKVDKKISHTADGQLKNNPVRKVLNFQPKSKVSTIISRTTINPLNPETPKFPKPEFRAKKSLHLQARDTVRISGVCKIAETPIVINKNRMTLACKDNTSSKGNVSRKTLAPPKVFKHRLLNNNCVPDTPLSNESWKSNCDASFLQNEKNIHDIEEKAKALSDEHTLDNIAEVTPPVSTPFKEYRNVQEYFNNSSELDCSALYNDDTIMCFDKTTTCKEQNKREDSVIVSLCDLLNKAKVSNPEKTSTELEDLLKMEKQTEYNIKMIDSGIQTLNNIKECQLKSLKYVRKIINEKRNGKALPDTEHDKTLQNNTDGIFKVLKVEKNSPDKMLKLGKPCSVIKSPLKSPSYKIPKKNLCLRKKVFHKSMPNIQTPNKDPDNRALNMYMKIKEQMSFLNTPVVKHTSNIGIPDTPAATSHNLQRQLDKLYGES